ncbi:MAG: hypothetical protein ABSH28_13380 [Acidobacteriota bacterium]|jgi:hypothetical protein
MGILFSLEARSLKQENLRVELKAAVERKHCVDPFWLLASGFHIPPLFGGISRAKPLPRLNTSHGLVARLHYDRDAGIVTYKPRPSSRSNSPAPAPERFSPLDALAALTAHIPDKRQQVVRYCGYYSNKARGQRRLRQQNSAGITPVAASLPEPEHDDYRHHCKRAWARLIRKIDLDDPLTCPNRKNPAPPQTLGSP